MSDIIVTEADETAANDLISDFALCDCWICAPKFRLAFARHAAQARLEALEEAAKACEDEMPAIQCMSVEPVISALARAASAIRSLSTRGDQK